MCGQMNNIVDREADYDDDGDGFGDAELPALEDHDGCDVGDDEDDGDDGKGGHDDVLRRNQHDKEGQEDGNYHALQSASVEGIFTFHEAPEVFSVLEHILKSLWRC